MNLKIAKIVLFGAMIASVMLMGRVRGDDDAVCKPTARSVEEQLKAKAEELAKKSPEAAKVFESGIAEVATTGIVQKAPKGSDDPLGVRQCGLSETRRAGGCG